MYMCIYAYIHTHVSIYVYIYILKKLGQIINPIFIYRNLDDACSNLFSKIFLHLNNFLVILKTNSPP